MRGARCTDLVELLPRFKGIATFPVGYDALVIILLNFCPASRGLRRDVTAAIFFFGGLNFCPASRGLRRAGNPTGSPKLAVELLPRFKGIATELCGRRLLTLLVELLPRFKGIATVLEGQFLYREQS